jgi:hypothetical protein
MKFYSPRLIIGIAAFIVGVCAVWLWLFEPQKQNSEVIPTVESQVENQPAEVIPQQIKSESETPFEPKLEHLKPVSIKDLRSSAGYWDKDVKNIPVQISRLSQNRKLAAVGDTLYMLDAKNRIVWTWTTGGAPLTDFPVIDSSEILYVIAYDLTFVALDSKNGEKLWQGTANGRAVYSQIELYKDDMYLVVTDMTGYRENDSSDLVTKDDLTLYKGNGVLWNTEIPVGAKIRVQKGEVFATFKRKKQTVVQKIKIPSRFDKFLGTIDEFGFGTLK